MSRPAPTNSIAAPANSEMMSRRRATVPLAPTAPRLLNAKNRSMNRPDTASAGVNPHATLVTSVIANPNARTCMSTDSSVRSGIDVGPDQHEHTHFERRTSSHPFDVPTSEKVETPV